MQIKAGTVVISSAGHDSGRWFVVTGAEGGVVYVADGRERKLLSPKKKNFRHVRVTTGFIDPNGLTDRKLRSALSALSTQSIAEESE